MGGSASPARLERRGRWWLVGSFLVCPCHLPITLAWLGMILSGTGLGLVVRGHTWLVGSLLTLSWAAGTWYGFRLLRLARNEEACPIPDRSR